MEHGNKASEGPGQDTRDLDRNWTRRLTTVSAIVTLLLLGTSDPGRQSRFHQRVRVDEGPLDGNVDKCPYQLLNPL